jgi:capsular exopolysaccharide synthesis family protein
LIQAASSNLESYRLGDFLVQGGYLEASDVHAVLSQARKSRTLFGETAVRRQAIEPVDLAGIVQKQAVELVQHVFQNGFTSRGFTPTLRTFYAPAQIHFGQLLLEISRNNAIPFEGDSCLLLGLVEEDNLAQLAWYPEELAVLSELTTPRSVAALISSTTFKESLVRKILGVLHALGVIRPIAVLEEFPSDGTADQSGRAGARSSTALVKRAAFPYEAFVPVVSNALVSDKLEVLINGSSFVSEQFKTLKVRIAASSKVPAKVITISSGDHQDGKSLVSANLAMSFSREQGRRVIIIDCDLRNPTLQKYLGVVEEPGLMQYLSNGHISPHCYLRRVENLYFLTSGGIAENPIELLSLRKMKDLIDYLKADFDTVILDAPPFSPIADARIITGFSDAYIMVVRRGKTSYSSLENAFRVMDQEKVLGVVFNDVKPMLFNSTYIHSHYKYGYGYGYGNHSAKAVATRNKNQTDREKYLSPD